jgi:multidrug transporter EmrE-like cation transporter
VLATLAWDRSLAALSVAFALWSLVSAASVATAHGGIAHHPIAVIGTAVLALLLVAAVTTRRANLQKA